MINQIKLRKFLKKNLVLTGMMGVGKSTIGRLLANQLNINFVDVDRLIEKNEKISIEKIFRVKGEKYFRIIEREMTMEVLKQENIVIALGGGAFIDTTIRNKVLKTSISFWLDAEVNLLVMRSKGTKKRPLLNNLELKENMKKIFIDRKKIYKLANYRIDCNSIQKKNIIKQIITTYESH